MSASDQPDREQPAPDEQPTRYGPTDFLSRHDGAEGHGDHRDRHVAEISPELNRRSPFIRAAERHAQEHPPARSPNARTRLELEALCAGRRRRVRQAGPGRRDS